MFLASLPVTPEMEVAYANSSRVPHISHLRCGIRSPSHLNRQAEPHPGRARVSGSPASLLVGVRFTRAKKTAAAKRSTALPKAGMERAARNDQICRSSPSSNSPRKPPSHPRRRRRGLLWPVILRSQNLRRGRRSCLSEGAWGFSPTNECP